ncbi:DUF547 domain-containing protein [Hymenobacter guriensis]|uniref:DUF547 domain-containing protein n=1 Tax=Hymenobacter guriensis TaxID=2793065 RepID=A0ABS0KWF0_9BACT|nr:DUF547 domain-containing protein [Hymenobacter guriensis]MBG8552170.1 DUF547 domain-containing protein [Hymenobacter guriensis]
MLLLTPAFRVASRLLGIMVLCWLLPLATATAGPAPSHAAWTALLARHVLADGRVDYRGFRADEDALAEYLEQLDETAPDPATWSPNDIKAYWINAYNAHAVSLVLQYYPLSSLTDARIKSKATGSFSPWEAPVVYAGGQTYSLNQVEKQFLQAAFRDARVHFALVQAAVSSPPLLNEAYEGARLEQQLEAQTRRFLNDPTYNQLTKPQPQLSSLFDWYGADFGTSQPALLAFVNRYAHAPLAAGTTFSFLPFDWHLNDRLPLSDSQALKKP